MASQNTNELELLQIWFKEMDKPLHQYEEPILEESSLKILKIACDTFKQDIHVFITSIEVLEEYIRRKLKNEETLYDEVLILATSIFISSKYTGELIDLKIKYIIKFLQKLTNVDYQYKIITATEIEILRTLGGSLPLATIVDDINTVIELHVRESRLKANVRPLCLEILQLIYICRKRWFTELKNLYCQNEDSFLVFKFLMVNRLYIPVVVLITSLHLTNYKHILDIHSVINDITQFSKIHSDHLNILAGIMINLIRKNC
ncbi:hypothetical protein WA026_001919 [Henosepilachna vigintioctopunctata]|uniref:Cyclin N-terminal domain-containing protein n=1 Tax=Henosepilachna vigintioctopunctata TaxID=420089 RepID=A0AAW1USG8_9CUCU